MTNDHSTAPTLLVAIDISKHRHEVLIGVPGKKRRRRMTILNTLDDFQRLVTALASYELPVRIPDYQLLTTIPGIGPINAMTILAEAGDLRWFRHHRQFLKFCGMDLATMQSGMFRGQSRISKYGNARLRRTLWMAGQTAVLKRTNSFRDKFERYISKDRHNAHLRRKAYTAIAATLLGHCCAMP